MNLFDILDPLKSRAPQAGTIRQYDPWVDSSEALRQASEAQWGQQLQESVMPEVRRMGDFLAGQNPAVNMPIGMMGGIRHPAQYSKELLPFLDDLLKGYRRVADPFGGVGTRLRSVRPDAMISELEKEWAAKGGGLVADALRLPYRSGALDAVVTSPPYGNFLARPLNPNNVGGRYVWSYADALGRDPTPGSAARMWFGPKYKEFHENAWQEINRVLRPEGRFLLNIKDFIRKGEPVPVSEWQRGAAERAGFKTLDRLKVPVKSFKAGDMAKKGRTIDYENIYVLEKPR